MSWEDAYRDIERTKMLKRQWQKNNRARYRGYQIKNRYGLSLEQYEALLDMGCGACGGWDDLHIDHDHDCCLTYPTCGKCIRGVLCESCNLAAGLLKNDPARAEMLVGYLAHPSGVLTLPEGWVVNV